MSNSVKAYLGNDPYIFVSYAHKDKEQVLPFIAELQKRYNVWFDEGIHVGTEWEEEIYERLEACDLFIYMITPASLVSKNCKDEIRTARDLNKNFINIVIDSKTELTKVFKFRYGGYQMFFLDTYATLESAVDDLVRKSKAGWFESVCKSGTDVAIETSQAASIGTSNETSATIDTEYEDDVECDSKCSDESESKASKIDTYRREGDYIYFGEYPQTIKADNVNITSKTDSRGYYLGSDGAYYAKVVATPYESQYIKEKYKFSTGENVQKGVTYCFKVEPIKWKILNEKGGVAFVVCDSIIANRRFDNDSNNYAESEIRAWLNDTFYNKAFSALQQGIIEITEVDNSARSTNPAENAKQWDDGKNEYACADTRDKIFLLSEQDATMTAYGFSAYDSFGATYTRCRQTSDYTRATGAYMSTNSNYFGNGWWWLRSPDYDYSGRARVVDYYGYANYYGSVNSTFGGVVPALRIRL